MNLLALALATTAGYALLCLVQPYAPCRACTAPAKKPATARKTTPRRKAKSTKCRRCKGRRIRLRTGRRLINAGRRAHRRITR